MRVRIALLTRASFSKGPWRAVIVLTAAVGFALAATPGRAQCGDTDEIVEEVFDRFYDQIGEEFFRFFGEEICDKLTETVVKTCQKAVSDNMKCYERVFKGVLSGGKTACSTTGSGKSECNAYYKSQNEDTNEEIALLEQLRTADCEDEADVFWNLCYHGLN